MNTTPHRRHRARWSLAFVASSALVVAACGSDSKSSSSTAAPATTAAATTTAAAATTTAPAGSAPGTEAATTDSTAGTTGTTGSLAPGDTAPTVSSPNTGKTAAEKYTTNLKGVCPDNVVVQTNWWPEPDHAPFYELIGPDGKVDTSKNTYSGPLGGTGVNLEIRAGGPALGYQQVTSLLYQDDSILLGLLGTDEQIANSAAQPTTALLAWYQTSPQIFLWGNPDWDFKSVKDIGDSGATVLAFDGATYLDVFTGEGLLQSKQIDTSYQGGPARFVAADGKIVQQGFVTAEPYQLENETPEWNKPVKYLLVAPEYPVYQNEIGIRSDKLAANKDCLAALIPLLQQASVDYEAEPAPINGLLVDYVSKIDGGGFTLSAGGVAYAAATQIKEGIVANGPDGVFGSFDEAKVQKSIDELVPVFAAKGKAAKDGLKPTDLYDTQFLDPTIKLS